MERDVLRLLSRHSASRCFVHAYTSGDQNRGQNKHESEDFVLTYYSRYLEDPSLAIGDR